MPQDRIAATFQRAASQRRPALIVYLTTGFPDLETTRELVPALVEAGADAVELGIPFSDPLADGPTVQASTYHALQQGITPEDCLTLVSQLRLQVPDTPLVLMTYYNPILSYGLAAFAARSESAGVDGLIMVDVPPEEAAPMAEQCRPRGIHIIPLLAPTSTEERIEKACQQASGFIYCVSLTGVTGARDQVSQGAFRLAQRVRAHTSLPIAIGFGISKREHVEAVGQHAQGAVVGSALVRVIQSEVGAPRAQLVRRAQSFVAELAGTAQSMAGGIKK